MVDHGCKVLDAADITAGSVSVTPAATPTDGAARVEVTRTVLGKVRVVGATRVTAVNVNDLDITLQAEDRVGHKLWWWSI